MALVLPGQNPPPSGGLKQPTSGGSRGLTLPGTTEAEKKKMTNSTAMQYAYEQRVLDAEASRTLGSRFLEEMGITAKDVAQGVARSFIATGGAIVTGAKRAAEGKNPFSAETVSTPFVPTTGFERALVGDNPVSFKTIGEEYAPLLKYIGVSEETASKTTIPVGLFMGLLDVIPGLPGKKKAVDVAVKELAGFAAKETSEEVIEKGIRLTIKGDDDAIKALSSTLAKVDNAEDAAKLIDASLRDGKLMHDVAKVKVPNVPKVTTVDRVPAELRAVAEDISRRGLTKTQFVDELSQVLKQLDNPAREAAAKTIRQIDELGLTPGKFFDMARGGGNGLDRIGRELLNVPAPRRVTKLETTLLKDKIKTLSRGAREGSQVARKEIFDMQDEVVRLASDNLPPSMRGNLLVAVRNANTPAKLDKAVEFVSKKIDDFVSLKAEAKALSGKRSKIGYLKHVGEFNQTAIRDAKKTLGIDEPIRQMSSAQLDQMIGELSKRFEFKKTSGMLPNVPKTGATKASEDFYKSFVPEKKTVGSAVKDKAKTTFDSIKDGAEDFLGVVSTRLANIDPTLKYALRKFEYKVRVSTLKDAKSVKAFTSKLAKLPAEELTKLDIAMKNGFIDDVTDIAKANGFESELNAVRSTLDDIYRRANEVGLDVDYRRNFFPRSFKTDKASVRGVLEYFNNSSARGVVQKAWAEASAKLGRVLTDAEKVDVINTLMRGFRSQNVTLSKTGALKSRVIDVVTPELNQFYDSSFDSLFRYVEGTNNLIESRRFFGKHLDLKNLEPNAAIDDVIGSYVNNLIAAGKISVDDQLELSRILKARFSGKEMAPWLGALKNVGYLSVMSSPLNAITQIGDLALAFYRAGLKAVPGLADSTWGKGLTRSDLGIENLAAEFSNKSTLSKWVDRTFKAVGLDRVDRLGKETFINGTWRSLRAEAIKSPDNLTARLTPVFGKDTQKVVRDLVSGEATEDVKYLLFNELLDFQPAALSEVPLKYLESPNGRIFYALKTYMIKTWDVYRREAFQLMKNPGTRAQGVKNLVALSGLLMVFNGIADEIKDTITGDDTDLSDRLVESFVKAFGFSKYTLSQVGQEGLGRTVAEQILPPTQFIDDLSKDFKDVFVDQDEDAEVSNLRTIRDIPVGGKLFYWWFGRGQSSQEKERGKEGGGEVDIPTVEIPTVEIPEIEIPTL